MKQATAAEAALPFEPQVIPERIFQHPVQRQARQEVLEALAAGWLPVVMGQSGTGKTLLLRELERTLRIGGIKVRLDGPSSATDAVEPDAVRLVDDAHLLDDATLHRLAVGRGATVLAILPHAESRVTALPVRVAPVRLLPLSLAEAADFVAAALAAGDCPPNLFSTEAVSALAVLSRGLPGHLNELGRTSLLQAQLQGEVRVEYWHVRRAAAVCSGTGPAEIGAAKRVELAGPSHAEDSPAPVATAARQPRTRHRLWPALPISLILLLALAGWLLPSSPTSTPGDGSVAATASGIPTASAWLEPNRVARTPSEDTPAVAAGGAPTPSAPLAGPAPAVIAGAAASISDTPARDGNRAAVAAQPASIPPRPDPIAPQSDSARVPTTPGTYRGTTYNETLGRGGGLRLAVTRVGSGNAVMVRFEASGGLVGAGQLAGNLSRDGRLVASGTLMMGQNPFVTALEGTISGNQLVGNVRYTRIAEPGVRTSSTRGTFRLSRD